MNNDTIAAVATSLSESTIGIVRISGDEAIKIVDKIFVDKNGEHSLKNYASHTIHYGFITENNEMIDEVMVSVMKAPKTFTREDVVEINCHGGVFVCKSVLEAVLNNGARLAFPGEFTKRAFLNGRIDLSKAEAVMDIISSESKAGLDNSLKHLNGSLYSKIKKSREEILYEIAFIESALDDPEHISLEGYTDKLVAKCETFKKEADELIATFKTGKILKDGIKTVIVGKPNVGKSSLLNVLTGEERAIVTDIAGTTRDTIEERVLIGDVCLKLIDTAGIRNTEDVVENIGVNRAKNSAKEADLVLFMIDLSSEFNDEDIEIYEYIKDKKHYILLNKTDEENNTDIEKIKSTFSFSKDIFLISCKDLTGISDVKRKINEDFLSGALKKDNELVITNVRQLNELKTVSSSLDLVKDSIEKGLSEDFYSVDLMNAYEAYGRIIGEETDDDLIDEIFSKFCMGK